MDGWMDGWMGGWMDRRRLSNIKKEVNSVMEDCKITDSVVREMQKAVIAYAQQMIHRIPTGWL